LFKISDILMVLEYLCHYRLV